MIRTVFLDLDDTLFDFKLAEKEAISSTLRSFGAEPSESIVSLYSRINKSCWESLERGEITRERLLYHRFELFFEKIGLKGDPCEARRTYEHHLSTCAFLMDGAYELLCRLNGRYELYITTNGTAIIQEGRIERSGIAKFFKDIFISEKLGANKPSAKFFELVFGRIEGFNKSEAIIVGDSLSSDIAGGIAAGIKTCWFNPNDKRNIQGPYPNYEIKNLCELEHLLAKL